MKLNFPLLKRCAFAVTLLSMTHLIGHAEGIDEQFSALPQEELMATAEEHVLTDTLFDSLSSDDLLLNDEEFASNLVAGSRQKKRNKSQNRSPQLEMSQANNTWVPKFVWMGDVQNSDDLKCFATFLIGSMSDQKNAANNTADFDPGVFMTPDTLARSNYNPASPNEAVAYKSKSHNNHKRNASNGPRVPKSPKARVSLDLHGGGNFLFFRKYKGNLVLKPLAWFTSVSAPGTDLPVKGRVKYDVAPLLEMDAIFNFFRCRWLGFGGYAQTSQGTVIRTKSLESRTPSTANTSNADTWSSFKSTLDLNALGGKLVFNFPNLVRFKTCCMGVYLGGGAGIGFQTWKDASGYTVVNKSGLATVDAYEISPIWNTRYMTNLTYTGDAAISFRSRNPYTMMTCLKFGCKFIGWGHTSSLGKAQSPGHVIGYWKPISFQNIFSIVPYMGFSWSF